MSIIKPSFEDFLPPLADEPPHPVAREDAITATLGVVIRPQLAPYLARLRRGEPLCLVVVPTSADWCAPLATTLEKLAGRRTKGSPFGESLILARSEPPRPTSSSEDAGRVVSRLSKGRPLLGISHAPELCLPPALLRAADAILRLPPLSGRQLRRIVLRVTGEDPGKLPADLAGAVTIEDIATCVRPGGGGADALRRLEAARAARTRTRSIAAPPLEMLAGYGEAKVWGLGLVREVARCRAGEVGLGDLPRGLLLSGPPGCGKTLFAQALARSAGLPIIATSAASWISAGDGHLGDAIKGMRAEFEKARTLLPAILFIDEVDALVDPVQDGSHGKSWWLSFRAALLACVDGAATEPGLILLGACNHANLVDAALKRAGRLDRHIALTPPSPAELAAILRTQLGEELAGDDLAPLGQLAAGSSGAEIARAVREARATARDAGRPLALSDLVAAIAPSDPRDGALLRLIAFHEAGHAVVAHVLGRDVAHVSLLACRETGGHASISQPQRLSRETLEESVVILLAGRAADCVLGAGPCAGACRDLGQATRLLASARLALGLGGSLLALHEAQIDQVLVVDQALRLDIEQELDDLWRRTIDIVRRHSDRVTAVAEALLGERVIGEERLAHILQQPEEAAAGCEPQEVGGMEK
jgi:cell division protease FtsH